jgi:hypothetical protein
MNNERNSGYVFLTKSVATAKEVLGLTFRTYSYEFLTEHLHMWLNRVTEDPEAEILFENLDMLLENHTTRELMEPERCLEGIGQNRYARFVGLFIFLLQLVRDSWKIYGKALRQRQKNAWQMNKSSINYRRWVQLIKTNDVQLVQQTLLEAIISITGSGYYQYFLNSLKRSEQKHDLALTEIGKDPDIALHKNEMVLFVSFRCFVDSTFFLVNSEG